MDGGRGRRECCSYRSTRALANAGEVDMPAQRDRDEELLGALRQREPAAAERLVVTYRDRAYRLAARITQDGQDAEEVVQDAFWAVIRKIDSFRGESAFGTWLFRIVTNAAYQKLRSRQSRRRDVPWDEALAVSMLDGQGRQVVPMSGWSSCVDDHSARQGLRAALTDAIDELPSAYRTVLVLRDVRGLSSHETAELLSLSVPAVKTRVHRARSFLRKELGDVMATPDATPEPTGNW
jgi:RNA polymerase sigma-70 factor, ECF subfamily